MSVETQDADAAGDAAARASGDAPETTSTRTLAVVINPSKRETPRLREAISRAARETGWGEPTWIETTVDDPGYGQAKEALEQGAELVLAAGGDGTVRSVAAALRGTGTAMGIVPAGTGNLLARNLKLPLSDFGSAARLALTSDPRRIDLGVAELDREDGSSETVVYCVMGGLGIDAAMIANTSDAAKSRIGWIAYVGGIGRSLGRLGNLKVRYRIDEERYHGLHMSAILIGNCGILPGNIVLLPDAKLDDGQLDVAVMQPRSIFGWLVIWRAVSWENRVLRRFARGRELVRHTTRKRTSITYLRGREVALRTEEPQTFEVDGDAVGEVVRVVVRVDEKCLVVRAPGE